MALRIVFLSNLIDKRIMIQIENPVPLQSVPPSWIQDSNSRFSKKEPLYALLYLEKQVFS